MKNIVILLLALTGWFANAKVEVLFHPHDPTFEKIADWIAHAEHSVDIAMYSMDGTPVIEALKAPGVKEKIESGALKIRLIYEGYDSPEENIKRMSAFEEMGIDVRYLGKGAKMHHKFAVIDSGRVISGSANWSLYSYRNYNENILFFEGEQEATYRFHREFGELWDKSKEFGAAHEYAEQDVQAGDRDDFSIFFNSPRILKTEDEERIYITDQIVRLIDEAQSSVDIATTRIRLQPVLEAVDRAAKRGVQVRIVLSQDDYHDLWKRAQWLIDVPNIQLRVKFYNLKVSNYMTYQMHNKFLIVDHQVVATGSFNWSNSGENNHIENLLELRGPMAQEVIRNFDSEFAAIWDMGRNELSNLEARLAKAKETGELPKCGFKPIVLEVREIKQLLRNKCAG